MADPELSEDRPEEVLEASAPDDAATSRSRLIRRRSMQLALFGIIAGVVAMFVLPTVPRKQRLRLHLGIGSSSIVAVTARIGPVGSTTSWDREATWRFPNGAPPSIEWTFELPDGQDAIEVELSKAQGASPAPQRSTVDLRSDAREPAQVQLRLE